MAEDIPLAYGRLEATVQFREFKKQTPRAFLASFSLMSDCSKISSAVWQIDFFNPETGRMTSFVMGDIMLVKPEQEILATGKVAEINMGQLKINFEQALAKASEHVAQTSHESVQTVIAVLQDDGRLRWALTFMTSSMKIITVKIDASTGGMIDASSGSLIQPR